MATHNTSSIQSIIHVCCWLGMQEKISLESAWEQLSANTISRQQLSTSASQQCKPDACAKVTTCCSINDGDSQTSFYPIFSEGRGGFCIQAKRPLRRRFGADWCPLRAQSFHATLWSPVGIKINTNIPYDNTVGPPIDSALLFIVPAIWIIFQTIKVLSTAIDGMTWMEINTHGHGCCPTKERKKCLLYSLIESIKDNNSRWKIHFSRLKNTLPEVYNLAELPITGRISAWRSVKFQ